MEECGAGRFGAQHSCCEEVHALRSRCESAESRAERAEERLEEALGVLGRLHTQVETVGPGVSYAETAISTQVRALLAAEGADKVPGAQIGPHSERRGGPEGLTDPAGGAESAPTGTDPAAPGREGFEDRIEKRPGKCGGNATIKGTRLMVRTLHGTAAAGHDVYALWPEVPRGDIDAALAYAKAHPEEVAPEPYEDAPTERDRALEEAAEYLEIEAGGISARGRGNQRGDYEYDVLMRAAGWIRALKSKPAGEGK